MQLSFLEVDLFPRINRFYAGSINKQFLGFSQWGSEQSLCMLMCVPLPIWASSHLLLGSHARQTRPILWLFFSPKDVCFRVTLSALLCCKAYSLFLFQKLPLSSSVSIHLPLLCYFSVETVFLPRPAPSPKTHYFLSPCQFLPYFAAPSSDCLSLLYFCRRLFALVTGDDYVGLSSFGPHAVCGQGQLWPSLSEQGATDVERQTGRLGGEKKKIWFAIGVKWCAVSDSYSPFSPSMSPIFFLNISLMLGRIIRQATLLFVWIRRGCPVDIDISLLGCYGKLVKLLTMSDILVKHCWSQMRKNDWRKESLLFCDKKKEECDKSIRLVVDIWHT